MRNFSKVSLGALFIVLNASPAFAELASKSYVERKATVSDAAAADVGKIAIYAADGSGQKIAASIGAAGSILRSDGTSAFWDDDKDHITTASTSGIGNAVTAITADGDGALSVVKGAIFLTSADLPAPYTLPAATSAILGGVKLGSDTVQAVVANAVATTTGRTFAIQKNASDQLVVNVGVDADTIYTGTDPIAVSGKVISHYDSGVTPNTYGPGANATLTHGGTFTVPSVTVDVKGHLTGAATRTFTMPSDTDTIDSVATGTTTGTSNAYALAATGFVLTKGSHVVAKINVANSTTSTLNVNGTGAKTIQFEGAALTVGMLKVNTDYTFVYDGTNWQMLSDNDTIYTHPTITRSDTTSAQALTYGGTVDIVDSVLTNAAGHLTGINVKTATLPALYTLPAATSTILGGVKLASDTAQSIAANSVTATAGKTYGIQNNGSGQMVVNVPWTDTNNRAFNGDSTAGTAAAYTLAVTKPTFTASDLTAGSMIIATIHLANSASPTLSVGGQTAKPIFMTKTDAAATADALKADTIYSFTFDGSKWYAKLIDTVYTHPASGVTAAAYGPTANATLTSGGTFTVPGFTVDANGHTTVAATRTMTMPTIPTVNDAALTVTQNGVSLGSNYTANTATARTYSIVAPDWAAAVGAKDEIKNKPTLAISTAETAAGVGGLDGFIPRIPFACTQSNVSCSLNYGKFSYDSGTTGTGHGISTGTNLGFFWELIVR